MSVALEIAARERAADTSVPLAADVGFCRRTLSLPPRAEGGRPTVETADDSLANLSRLRARYGRNIRIRTISRPALIEALEARFRGEFLDDAINGLDRRHPELSAKRVVTRGQAYVFALLPLAAALALWVEPGFADAALALALGFCFLGNSLFRAVLVWLGAEPVATHAPAILPDDATLPRYSVLIPLYREAEIVPSLLDALRAMDYPPALLEIFLVVEADDHETRAAIEAAGPDSNIVVLPVPPCFPRTKPKAVNYALGFATGEFTVIYDAEDRPEPDQLRKAVAAFRTAPESLGCLQARLNFYNAGENWLTCGLMAHLPEPGCEAGFGRWARFG